MVKEKAFDVRYMKMFLTENYGNINYFNCIMVGETKEKVEEKFKKSHDEEDILVHINEIKEVD